MKMPESRRLFSARRPGRAVEPWPRMVIQPQNGEWGPPPFPVLLSLLDTGLLAGGLVSAFVLTLSRQPQVAAICVDKGD